MKKEKIVLDNIPDNIGYDPYWGVVILCKSCGHKQYLFGDMLRAIDIAKSEENVRRKRRYKKGCRGCGNSENYWWGMLDRKDAFHKNDIRFRGTSLNKKAAVNL